jgi:hypothetical protein
MRRTAPLVAATLLWLAAAACSDSRTPPTAPLKVPTGRLSQLSPTVVPLDPRILTLADSIFPKGLGNAFAARWTDIKRQLERDPNGTLPDGKKGPAAAARKMQVELVQWIQGKTGDLTPPAGETKAHVAARLVLYMSLYVYGGPTTPPPAVTATSDAVLSIVSPTAPDTVQTPTQHAGVVFDAGAVTEPTIVVVALETAFYPDNCSGPLLTHLCQYPRFYRFNVFPDVRLQHPAHVAVCHVDAGTNRLPLADHNRFRLAHDKPVNPADYMPGGTVVDSIEILPLVWLPTLINCAGTDYTNTASAGPLNSRSGGGFFGGLLERGGHALRTVASAVGRFIAPRSAYAIDGGGGGDVMDFSNFAVVDPDGAPDRAVQSVGMSPATAHAGDHVTLSYSVKNVGTATGTSVPATLRLSTTPTISAASPLLAPVTIPAQPPGAVDTVASVDAILPSTLAPGTWYVGLLVADDPTFPDANLSNNSASSAVTIDPDFISATRTFAVGETSVCGIDAAAALDCWGDNSDLQFGASGPAHSSPFTPPALQSGFVQLSFGNGQFFCGIKADRSAVCWGRSGFGQLGGGTAGNSPANLPVSVAGGVSWANIFTGRLSACGVSTSGTGYCWGSNQWGEVGRASVPMAGSNAPASLTTAPAPVDGVLTFKSIVAGWLHACGITTSGAAYCWGANGAGQLGIGTIDTNRTHRSPAPVVGGLQFIQLSLGSVYSCGITVDHQAYCWGENFTGQLGDATTANRGSPTLVAGGQRFAFIAAGSGFASGSTATVPPSGQAQVAHVCALTETGAPWCWGWNGAGQLGDGTTADHTTPAPVSGSLQLTSLGLGGSATCGRRGNAIWCWGGNVFGQLGNGTVASSSVPVLVQSPFSLP